MAQLATLICILGIAGLLYFDRERGDKSSPAIWVAALWTFIGASRMISQWSGGMNTDSPDQYLEGSALDRWLLSCLLGIALAILAARWRRVTAILRDNPLIFVFFLYCLISVMWSEFPAVAIKRWSKALGNVSMVLLVITDDQPLAAIKRFFARTGFFLIPLSVLLIKYYPNLGRGYLRWSWEPIYFGVSTDKNGLGCICLVFGLASVWRVVMAYQEPASRQRTRVLLAHSAILVMNFWLFHMANSATSMACFALGSALILLTARRKMTSPRTVHAIAAVLGAVVLFIYLFPDTFSAMVEELGRNTTLTGRTDIWNDLFKLHLEPWLGTGFESFWLGDRAKYFWMKYYFHPNQAHNGYIETYVNLGLVGVGLLAVQILAGYHNVVAGFRRKVPASSLKLTFFVIALIYNITEASFKVMHPIWITFLFAIIAVPQEQTPGGSPELAPAENLALTRRTPDEDSAMRDFVMNFTARKITS